mgnify:CR=1 FL=1
MSTLRCYSTIKTTIIFEPTSYEKNEIESEALEYFARDILRDKNYRDYVRRNSKFDCVWEY